MFSPILHLRILHPPSFPNKESRMGDRDIRITRRIVFGYQKMDMSLRGRRFPRTNRTQPAGVAPVGTVLVMRPISRRVGTAHHPNSRQGKEIRSVGGAHPTGRGSMGAGPGRAGFPERTGARRRAVDDPDAFPERTEVRRRVKVGLAVSPNEPKLGVGPGPAALFPERTGAWGLTVGPDVFPNEPEPGGEPSMNPTLSPNEPDPARFRISRRSPMLRWPGAEILVGFDGLRGLAREARTS
jgi:hypothetical protein